MHRGITPLLALALLLATLAGLAPAPVVAQDAASAEHVEEVALRLYEVFNSKDPSGLDNVLAPDFVNHTPTPGFTPDREGLKGSMAFFAGPFPDQVVTVDEVIVEGNKAVVRQTVRGTHTGEAYGAPPTGNPVVYQGVNLLVIEGDFIVESWGVYDTIGILVQIGLMPAPAGAGTPTAGGMAASPAGGAAGMATPTGEEAKAIVRPIYDALAADDAAALQQIFSPDFVELNPAPGAPADLAGFQGSFQALRAGMSDLQIRVEYMVAEGGAVGVLVTVEGTHDGTLLGVPATGRHVVFPGIDVYHVAGGQVTEHWGLYELFGLFLQITTPAPTGTPAATPTG